MSTNVIRVFTPYSPETGEHPITGDSLSSLELPFAVDKDGVIPIAPQITPRPTIDPEEPTVIATTQLRDELMSFSPTIQTLSTKIDKLGRTLDGLIKKTESVACRSDAASYVVLHPFGLLKAILFSRLLKTKN